MMIITYTRYTRSHNTTVRHCLLRSEENEFLVNLRAFVSDSLNPSTKLSRHNTQTDLAESENTYFCSVLSITATLKNKYKQGHIYK